MRVVLLGPESTGKSTLATALAQQYKGIAIPEYARTYVEHLRHPYTYADVEAIAHRQIDEWHRQWLAPWVFYDTNLIITKIWFLEVYHRCPAWVEEALVRCLPDAYLICRPDLPFVEDPVRENPHRREYLLQCYLREVEQQRVPYAFVGGQGEERLQCASEALATLFCA